MEPEQMHKTDASHSPEENGQNNEQQSREQADEQDRYLEKWSELDLSQKKVLLIDATTTAAKALNSTFLEFGESVNAVDKNPDRATPRQLEIVEAYKRELVNSMKAIEINEPYLQKLKEYRKIELYDQDVDELFTQALNEISKKMNIAVPSLRAACDAHSLLEEEQEAPNELSLKQRAEAVTAVYSRFVELEEKSRLELVDMDLSPIDSVIEKAHVSTEQKEQWKTMLSLDLPKNARIKIIPILGGEGLSMKGELDHIKQALEKAKGKSTLSFANVIDNEKLSKEEILATIQEEEMADDADFIILYASTHGFTPSVDTPEVPIRLGLTELDSPDDVFHIQNGQASDTAAQKFNNLHYYLQAQLAVQVLLEDQPNLFKDKHGQPLSLKSGEVVRIGENTIRIIKDTAWPEQLIERLSYCLYMKDLAGGSVSTDDLCKVQQEAIKKTPGKEILYILDNCFSGSATNDRLASENGTKAILTASSAIEPARQNEKKQRGEFMSELFRNVELGCSLGEAFVRTDLKLNFSLHPRFKPSENKKWQNPGASMKDKNGKVIRVGSISNSPNVYTLPS